MIFIDMPVWMRLPRMMTLLPRLHRALMTLQFKQINVEGLDGYLKAVAELPNPKSDRVFALFCGAEDEHGNSWCGDCVAGSASLCEGCRISCSSQAHDQEGAGAVHNRWRHLYLRQCGRPSDVCLPLILSNRASFPFQSVTPTDGRTPRILSATILV